MTTGSKEITVRIGPHGGGVVRLGEGHVEVALERDGDVFRFRLYFSDRRDRPVSPPAATVNLATTREHGAVEHFLFLQRAHFLESTGIVRSPHEFDVDVRLIAPNGVIHTVRYAHRFSPRDLS